MAEVERLRSRKQSPITQQQGEAMRKKIGAVCFKECSALTHEGLKDIFDEAIKVVLFPETKKKRSSALYSEECSMNTESLNDKLVQ